MLQLIHLRRLLLQGAALFSIPLFPVVISAASLRSMSEPWPARHFNSEAAGIHIPFEYVNGHIFLTVIVNGRPGYVFLLDTGTSVDVLDLGASRALGIPIEKITHAKDLGFGGGKVSMAGARHLDLRMQDLEAQQVLIGDAAAIVDLRGLARGMNHSMDGILGYPLLRRFVVGINFATDDLVLWPKRDFRYQGKGDVMRLIQRRDHAPEIPVTVGTLTSKTRKATVEVDTGSDASLLLYSQYAKRARIDDIFSTENSKLKPAEGFGLGGCFPVLRAMLASMTMGNVQFGHFIAFMMQSSPALTQRRISGVLGTSVLDSYERVIFDVPHDRMIFELAAKLPMPQKAKLGRVDSPAR